VPVSAGSRHQAHRLLPEKLDLAGYRGSQAAYPPGNLGAGRYGVDHGPCSIQDADLEDGALDGLFK
jgi:hypothetical protein